MKLTTNVLTAITLLSMNFSMYAANASNSEKINTSIVEDVPTEKWTLVKETNGVQASLSITNIKGERFLSVKLENTTSENLNLILSLIKNNETVIITHDEMTEAYIQIGAEATHVLDGAFLIYLSDEDQISDFNITINATK
jgi:hypothetical protein